MTDKRTLGQGTVEILLINAQGEERTYKLKPSIHAMRMLSRKHGGLNPLVEKISKLDFDTIVEVIQAGIQAPQSPRALAEMEELVYHTGFSDSTGQLPLMCIRYVTVLIHGGRLPPEERQQEADEGNGPQSS